MSFNNSLEASSGPIDTPGANPDSLVPRVDDSLPISFEMASDRPTLTLNPPESFLGPVPAIADEDAVLRGQNRDDCDVCGQGELLLLCDGCPLSIHFGCLVPPTTQEEFERTHGTEEWFCNECSARRQAQSRPSPKGNRAKSSPPKKAVASTSTPAARPKRAAAKRKRDDDAFEDDIENEIEATPSKRARREPKTKVPRPDEVADGGEEGSDDEGDNMDIEIQPESKSLISIELSEMATDEGSSMDGWVSKREWIVKTDFAKPPPKPKAKPKARALREISRKRGRPRKRQSDEFEEDDGGEFGEEGSEGIYRDDEEEGAKEAAPRTSTHSGRRIREMNYREVFEKLEKEDEDDFSDEGSEEGDSDEALEEEGLSASTPWVPDSKVLDKILCHRDRNKALLHKSHFQQPNNDSAAAPSLTASGKIGPDYEFLVKWKNLAYIHCEWVPAEHFKQFRMGGARIERYWKGHPHDDPEEPFNPEFTEVDRILAEGKRDGQTYYFVKWQGLQYDESTWESADDINDDFQLQRFRARNQMPPRSTFVIPPRPPSDKFSPIQKGEFKNGNVLRSYQLDGLNWLLFSWYNRTNTILADEMGLGKTVQSVMMLNHLFTKERNRGPFLVVVPLSTLHHWQREIEAWTEMNPVIFHGNQKSRDLIREVEWTYGNEEDGILKWNVLLTTYEMVLQENSLFESINWQYLIIDEAHRLKNKASRLTKELARMSYEHITLLTGTPIQNNMQELFTLLNILDSKNFPHWSLFETKFGDLKEVAQVKELQGLLKRYLLRRMKEDVEKSIAPKEETIIEVELTALQKKFYRAILERNFDNLVKGAKSNNLPSLMNVMMQLRKCCNHPYLLEGVEELELAGASLSPDAVHARLIAASGKLVLIDKLLPHLRKEGHKVLIFSQMIHVLDLIEDYLNYRGYAHQRIDGRVRGNDRQRAIDRFCDKTVDSFVFLLCTRAGGVGINLTAADTVIIFDSDWNPQNDLQAQARCHRIGQDKKVMIYRLITRNTYEREMFDRASLKLGLDHAVLTQLNDAAQTGDGSALERGNEETRKLTSKEVDQLLKKGVYSMINDDDSQFQKFSELNIDQILKERTQVVVHKVAGEGGASSTFAKVSFSTTSTEPQVDVNDPDFWRKVLPESALKPEPVAVVEPRSRKQTKRFVFEKAEGDEEEEVLGDDSDDEDIGEVDLSASHDKDAVVNSEEDDDPESYSGEDDDGGEFGQRKRWGSRTLTTFLKTFLLFGFGRWETIRRHSGVTMSNAEMEAFATAYTKKVCHYLGKNFDETIAQLRATKDDGAAKDEDAMDIDSPAPAPAPGPALNYDHDSALSNSVFLARLKKSARIEFKRLTLLAFLAKLATTNLPETAMPKLKLAAEFPAEWGDREDRDLIRGIYKHGFGAFHEVASDHELIFHSKYRLKDKRGEKGPVLPSFKLLTAHVKKLLMSLRDPHYRPQGGGLSVKSEKKDKDSDDSLSVPAAAVRRASLSSATSRLLETRESWFKNEYASFYKIVTAFGLPLRKVEVKEEGAATPKEQWAYDFEWIKTEGKLKKKSVEQIRARYAEIVNMSKKVLHYHAKGLLESHKSELTLTFIQSKRLIDRISHFAVIRRRILPLSGDQIELHLADTKTNLNLHRWKNQLPSWWSAPAHDRSLLQGVIKHGFGNWEAMLSDPELGFCEILNARLSEKGMPLVTARTTPAKKVKEEEEVEEDEDGEGEGEGEAEQEEEDEDEFDETTPSKKSKGKKKAGYHKESPYANLMQMPRDQVTYRRLTFAVKMAVESIARTSATAGSRGRNKAAEEALKVGEIEDFLENKGEEGKEEGEPATTMGPPRRRTAKEIDIERDESGQIKFPIEVDKTTRILALGAIKTLTAFHSLNYLFPVGFRSEKDYASTLSVNKKVTYRNEIVDGGDHPIFRVTPSDDPLKAVDATSASSAWKTILDRIQELRQEGSKRTSISGPEFFGFSHPMVMELLEALPGADQMPRLGRPGRKEEGATPEVATPRVSGTLNERMRALAHNKMPEDSMEVATDEGDDEDFLLEMQRAIPRGRYKPLANDDEEAGEDEGGETPGAASNILDYFRPQHSAPQSVMPLVLPPPPAMFANYLSHGDSMWDDPPPDHSINPLWDETYPPLDDPLSFSAMPPVPAPPMSRRLAPAPQQKARNAQGPLSAPHSPQKAQLENDVYNLGAALMQVEPGSYQETELLNQLEVAQNKLASFGSGQ